MKQWIGSFATAALVASIGMSSGIAADLNVGDAAPGFALPGSDGNTYDLSTFTGDRAVVIAWYPKAFTGG